MNGIIMSKKTYFALIGDIMESRIIESRESVQNRLSSVLSTLNEEFNNDFDSYLNITLGDEFQCLLHDPVHIMDIMERIELELYPISFRFGIGVGEIATNIIRETPFGMDGEAYHNARDCMDSMKNNQSKSKSPLTTMKIKGGSNTDKNKDKVTETVKLVNSVLMLISVMKNRWTPAQVKAINEYGKTGNQTDAAWNLSITQSALQQNLAGANYYSYVSAKNTVSEALVYIKEQL